MMDTINVAERFQGPKNTTELLSCAQELILNQQFESVVDNVHGQIDKFRLTLDMNIRNENDVDNFLDNYLKNNGETVRISKIKKLTSRSKYCIENYYRCQHNTRVPSTKNVEKLLKENPSKRFKNTNCPFAMSIKVLKDPNVPLPAKVVIEWEHNHALDTLQVNSFKDISDDVKTIIWEYYCNGLSPGMAYKEFTRNIRAKFRDNLLEYHKALADRSICPRRRDFNKLYGQFNVQKFGGSNLQAMLNILESEISNIKETHPGISIEYCLCDEESPLIIAFVTPMMKRIHQHVQEAGEMVFVDSSSNMDEYNLRIFLVVTHSVLGALPLGVLICSDEKTETLIRGFSMLKQCLDATSFYGRGNNGPIVSMTDNCDELHDALLSVWPSTQILLCLFHMLKQVWTWLNDKNHFIDQNDRQKILLKFKAIVYAKSHEEFESECDAIVSEEAVSKYPIFIDYFKDLLSYQEMWACCYRQSKTIRGNNTNNYVESQFNVIKDGLLKRCKEYNINGLLRKMVDDFNNHYESKLLSVAAGTFDGVYSRRFQGKKKANSNSLSLGYAIPDDIQQTNMLRGMINLGNNMFVIPSLSDSTSGYLVDMTDGVCTCFVGTSGSPCKHQYVIWSNRISHSNNFLPYFREDKETRQKYAMIAIGTALPLDWYSGLHDNVLIDSSTNDTTGSQSQMSFNHNRNNITDAVENKSSDKSANNSLNELKEKAKVLLQENLEFLLEKIDNSEKSLSEGIIKFVDRCKSMPLSRLPSAFHEFGNNVISDRNKTGKKRKSFSKCPVQPYSVKRRTTNNGSRQRQAPGRKVSLLKRPVTRIRRPHNFAENVRSNVSVPTKSRTIMGTKTKIMSKNHKE